MATRVTSGGPDAARAHALAVLEFGEVLSLIAEGAVGSDGAQRVLGLHPLPDHAAALSALDAVEDARLAIAGERGWELGTIPPARPALARLAIDGAVLEAEALIDLGTLLATSRRAIADLRDRGREGGVLRAQADRLREDRGLEERIDATFDATGEVADGASPELRRLRRRLQTRRSRLVDRLEEFARGLPERVRVADGSVTLRGGRYCVPVRREGKGTVGGIVHDASASRQTLFVEPPLAIEPMNEIRELELEVLREIERILRELSDALRGHRIGRAATFEALCELDAIRARALFAVRLGCIRPALDPPEAPLEIVGGRHPLLAARGGDVVPFDLSLRSEERVLLISGPNAGGKTVLLKSVGLIAALSRSGVIPPVGEGTRIPFFGGPFAIIGDEQSIEASLSTFGAQARNLAEILQAAGPDDLVLIDEIGSATDPAEGGALAAAVLADLATRVRLTIATTHLGDLKGLAEERPGTVNASLQFDAERLEPTYRLEKYRPGRSYALEIASRLGVPETVLADARARLDADHRTLDGLLARLEADQERVERERELLAETRARAEEERAALAAERAEVETRGRTLEEESARALEETLRAARTEVEEAISRLEGVAEEAASAGAVREAQREARDVVERGLRESRARRAARGTAAEARSETGRPVEGGLVRWGDSTRHGVLVELRGDRGVVDVDGVRLTVPAAELTPVEASRASPAGPLPERRERRPSLEARMEVDLRGLRVEEVEAALLPALDAALFAELPWLRIIHGKGTGALRQVVQGLLERDPRVPGFRSGEPGEGGTGVTVVELG